MKCHVHMWESVAYGNGFEEGKANDPWKEILIYPPETPFFERRMARKRCAYPRRLSVLAELHNLETSPCHSLSSIGQQLRIGSGKDLKLE